MGFSSKPNPKLIATYKAPGEAVAVSRGFDRDRVADETGNQTVVFGRRGARPFTSDEMKTFYQPKGKEELVQVEDVAVLNGKLTTKAGQTLQPTRNFLAETNATPTIVRPER